MNKKQKGSYWKLSPKLRKIEEKRWFKTYLDFNKDLTKLEDGVKFRDITPRCVMCSKEPVKWVIRVNDFKSDIDPEIDLRHIYCCSYLCTQRVCGLINMGGVEFHQRK